MSQISRPMQILLAVVLVGAAVYFVALRPKAPAIEPPIAVATTPAATTPPRTIDVPNSGLQSAVDKAKGTASSESAAAGTASAQTGEAAPAATPGATPAATPAGTPATGATATPGTPTAPAAAAPGATAQVAATTPSVPAAQAKANRTIAAVKADLQAGDAVVFLVWSKDGSEDKVVYRRITKEINKRHGKVKTYAIPVSEVGRYDGLLGGLNIGQTPSTIVIAPNNEAKVLGGIVTVTRLDRLTSSAVLIKPVPVKTTP